jgi:hypothetical protein
LSSRNCHWQSDDNGCGQVAGHLHSQSNEAIGVTSVLPRCGRSCGPRQ